jgi:asparagine synthase (glutamine-hydrolysing)
MCGIAGLILKNGASTGIADNISKMTHLIQHRGPDGEGIYCYRNLGLGHRRLAIIDVSPDGHQPMFYSNNQLVITYNGEIYNYIEIKQELENLGYTFFSQTDTEVILAAYAEWGQECVHRFNGMWAFAILDKLKNTVFCSRDRFGVKPFYYVNTPELFAFGSEIKQLLPFLKSVSANQPLLIDFLLTSISDHSDNTFFNDVAKLPASHNLVYSLDKNNLEIKPFYQLSFNQRYADMSQAEAIDTYMGLLESSIKLRLRADVPVGTCLSGGLDSSSVASIAAPLYQSAAGRSFNGITAVF